MKDISRANLVTTSPVQNKLPLDKFRFGNILKNWQQFCGVEILVEFHQKAWLVQQKGNTPLEEVPASWLFGKTSEGVYKAFRILMTT